MLLRKFSIGIGVALGLMACTGTPLSTVRDAAVDVKPVSDVAPLVPDAAVLVPDAAVVVPDAAVSVPDAALDLRDTAVPDTVVVVPDTARETAPNPFANRTFQISPQNPAPTPDPACTQYESVDSFLLTFGSDTSTLNGLAVRGSAATKFHATFGPESDRLTYHIDDLLAGGRVFIELDQGVYVGEVIVYGSGVPIARCLRGALSPQP